MQMTFSCERERKTIQKTTKTVVSGRGYKNENQCKTNKSYEAIIKRQK